MISGFTIVMAFKRNCPHVRLTKEEEFELARLVNIAVDNFYKTREVQTRGKGQ